MESLEMPQWLFQRTFVFDVHTVLKDSLYYPAAGFDSDPVEYFAGNVYSFLYVDYGISKEDLSNKFEELLLREYQVIHRESFAEEQLTPNGWTVYITPGEDENNLNDPLFRDWIQEPYCE